MPEAPVDVSQMTDAFGEDYELLSEIYQVFIEDCGARLESLTAIVASQDAGQCREVAHSIKGSSANVGASTIKEIAAALESDARAGDMSHAQERLDSLNTEFPRAKAFIFEYLDSIKP